MIKKIGALIGALTITITSVLAFSATALATNGEGFTIVSANPNTINPRRFIFELKPGDSIDDFVEVQNLAGHEETFLLYGADPTFSAQGTPAYKTRQAGGNGEGQWIKFEESEIKMTPNEKRIVRFTLQIPESAPKGDYRAGIAMEKAAHQSTAQPGISIATRIILHAEIKVTDNPHAIPKQDGTLVTNGKVTTPQEAQKADWRAAYFWISLVLFIVSCLALLWVTLAECFASKECDVETPLKTPTHPIAKSRTSTTKRRTSKTTKKSARTPARPGKKRKPSSR